MSLIETARIHFILYSYVVFWKKLCVCYVQADSWDSAKVTRMQRFSRVATVRLCNKTIHSQTRLKSTFFICMLKQIKRYQSYFKVNNMLHYLTLLNFFEWSNLVLAPYRWLYFMLRGLSYDSCCLCFSAYIWVVYSYIKD